MLEGLSPPCKRLSSVGVLHERLASDASEDNAGELSDSAGGGICGGLDLHIPGRNGNSASADPARPQIYHACHVSR